MSVARQEKIFTVSFSVHEKIGRTHHVWPINKPSAVGTLIHQGAALRDSSAGLLTTGGGSPLACGGRPSACRRVRRQRIACQLLIKAMLLNRPGGPPAANDSPGPSTAARRLGSSPAARFEPGLCVGALPRPLHSPVGYSGRRSVRAGVTSRRDRPVRVGVTAGVQPELQRRRGLRPAREARAGGLDCGRGRWERIRAPQFVHAQARARARPHRSM